MSADPSTWIAELAALDEAWQGGDAVTADVVAQTLAVWRERLQAPTAPGEEWFDVVDAAGALTGLTAPRWFCHLVGLRHRVVHVYLVSPQGLLLLQMRAHDKLEWASRFDTTVGGHLKAGQEWEAGALAEIAEEIGLAAEQVAQWLVGGRLHWIGAAYERYGVDPRTTYPYRNRQINQLFGGQITPWGMAHLRFADGEVGGMYLCTPVEAQRMIAADFLIAPGLRHSFARWWEWRLEIGY